MLGIRTYRGTAIDVYQGDLTDFACDVMVNSASPELNGASGVDAAIHRAGGEALAAECRALAPSAPGFAVLSSGGNLPCRYVIHAVAPLWQGGLHGEKETLSKAYLEAIKLTETLKLRHLAIAALATGGHAYPLLAAAEVAMAALKDGLAATSASPIKRITFVAFSATVYQHFQAQMFHAFPDA